MGMVSYYNRFFFTSGNFDNDMGNLSDSSSLRIKMLQ